MLVIIIYYYGCCYQCELVMVMAGIIIDVMAVMAVMVSVIVQLPVIWVLFRQLLSGIGIAQYC